MFKLMIRLSTEMYIKVLCSQSEKKKKYILLLWHLYFDMRIALYSDILNCNLNAKNVSNSSRRPAKKKEDKSGFAIQKN